MPIGQDAVAVPDLEANRMRGRAPEALPCLREDLRLVRAERLLDDFGVADPDAHILRRRREVRSLGLRATNVVGRDVACAVGVEGVAAQGLLQGRGRGLLRRSEAVGRLDELRLDGDVHGCLWPTIPPAPAGVLLAVFLQVVAVLDDLGTDSARKPELSVGMLRTRKTNPTDPRISRSSPSQVLKLYIVAPRRSTTNLQESGPEADLNIRMRRLWLGLAPDPKLQPNML